MLQRTLKNQYMDHVPCVPIFNNQVGVFVKDSLPIAMQYKDIQIVVLNTSIMLQRLTFDQQSYTNLLLDLIHPIQLEHPQTG